MRDSIKPAVRVFCVMLAITGLSTATFLLPLRAGQAASLNRAGSLPPAKHLAAGTAVATGEALARGAYGNAPVYFEANREQVDSLTTLGNYPNTTVTLGADRTVTPDAAPTSTTSINVSTNTNFNGTFAADPLTGVVRVTNAQPAGTYTVTVTAFDGGPSTKTFTLTVTSGSACTVTPGFNNAADVSVGSGPGAIAIGDFNNDGKQDLAATNNTSTNVSVILGNGDGTFGAATNFTVGNSPRSVAIGDFNNDGKQDLAVSNFSSNDVSVLLGNGAGSFGAAVNFSVGTSPRFVAIGDFNNDGKQDLAVANGGTNDVSVLLGDGAGSFGAVVNFNVGTQPFAVAIGDFNNDGKQDLVAANISSNNVSVLLGNGAGSFGVAANFNVGLNPIAVAIGDFNNDGIQDLAIANFSSNDVSVLLGNGAGSFGAAVNFGVGSRPEGIAIGDFNNDGIQDLVTPNFNSSNFSVLLGSGAGSFGAAVNFNPGGQPGGVAIGDFNNDGKQDVAVTVFNTNNVAIRLGDCVPEINVKGGSPLVSIVDGDTTPSTTDDTDFGGTPIVGGMVTHTFTIENIGTAALTITGFTLTGPNATEFALSALTPASPIPAGNSATFNLTFDPSATGLRTATLSIGNDDSDENPYDFVVQGTGTGPTAAPASISGQVTLPDGAPLAGVIIQLHGARSEQTITDSNGSYSFAGVDTETFYTVAPERANYSFSPAVRSFSLLANKTDASFTAAADAVPTRNPVDADMFFVRQQYLDFLGREPDARGLAFWTDQISQCGSDAACLHQKRIDVSAAFFASEEFQQTGSFIYRLYRAGLGRRLFYAEFSADRSRVHGGPNLEESKTAFAADFVQRTEFGQKYQNNLTAESFVDALLASVAQSSGLDLSGQRETLVSAYNTGANLNESHSLVLRALVDSTEFKQSEYNPSFVLMQYFGYLRRELDRDGYNFWLEVLNNRDQGNYRGMVCAFITSAEYQQRFSPVVMHTNAECSR